ncbi:hypothetical protein [Comamonas badia]|uniref:hypothetical protein n=1 Tax=Comamonas badia TaxID=265291 RepID=UPI00041635AF|nr:hypothetical protein [Comamonas badia]
MAAVWLIFSAALPGIVHFDDIGNLKGLASINDLSTAWHWVREGHAGPLGRPLSLITFALQYYEWPNPESFLLWNIAIHTINALLVLWLSVLITQRLNYKEKRQIYVGFFVAAAWATLPLLNTSVLFIVQRMTLLSATFVLGGLIAFLKLRGDKYSHWKHQLLALSALGFFGILAIFAKENGALIVVYALIIECLLIFHVRDKKITWAAKAFLFGNTLLLLGLFSFLPWPDCTELTRGFTVWDRLGSQGVILLNYLKGIFLPTGAELNPFRFEFFLRDHKNMHWGIVLWLTFMASPLIAWRLGGRRALPVALACAWFFYGHIMESGWLSLEPYFAHRNYLAALGPIFLLVAWFSLPKTGALWRGIGIIYLGLLIAVSWMNTSLWGNRALAAEIWAKQEPLSTRATLNLAYYLEKTQGVATAQDFLNHVMTTQRDSTGLRLQSLISACRLDPETDHSALVKDATHAIRTLPYEGWAPDLVENLLTTIDKQQCHGVGYTEIAEIATTFLNRSAYQCSKPIQHNLLSILGVVALHQGQTNQALDFLYMGFQSSPSYATAKFYLDVAQQNNNVEAIEKLNRLLTGMSAPKGTPSAEWMLLIEKIHVYLQTHNP